MVSSTGISTASSGALAASVQQDGGSSSNILGGAKRFIGAVEDEWQLYSDRAEDYTIGAPIGFGASSIVYAATYHPASADSAKAKGKGIPCALKVLDLDSLPPRSLQLLQRETTLMSLSKHPNVLRVRGSWMDGHKLYIALRLMNKGSAADVMRYGWPGGMEEDVVRCVLQQALKGLNYLHINGFIHRDIKAANMLIDDDGTVLLGDLGVAADLSEDTSHFHSSTSTSNIKSYSVTAKAALSQSQSTPQGIGTSGTTKRAVAFGSSSETPASIRPVMRKRKSFVGTPCWMSPELIQGKQYDSSADIWSFGITALELTQGRPPRSRESPQRVLLRTIQEDPPTLDRDGGVFKYSRAFKEVVDSCLIKDPSKRPTAEELLQTPFFKAAKKKSYLINTILKDLPPLTQRQERRVIPPLISANSVDSWDFATTVHSPTTSVYRRGVLEEFVLAEDNELKAAGMFDTDEDRDRERMSTTTALAHHLHTHLPVVDGVSEEEEPDPELEPDAEGGNEEVLTASSSPSTSQSSILSSDAAASHASASSTSPPNTSASSSYTSSSVLAHRLKAAADSAQDTSMRQQKAQAQDASAAIGEYNAGSTLIGRRSVLPDSGATPTRAGTRGSIGSPGAATLWHKFKSNVKRPARGGGEILESETFEGSPRKEKGKGMLSSAGKGLLGRGSSRTTPSKDAK